jgi:hypothetical protein
VDGGGAVSFFHVPRGFVDSRVRCSSHVMALLFFLFLLLLLFLPTIRCFFQVPFTVSAIVLSAAPSVVIVRHLVVSTGSVQMGWGGILAVIICCAWVAEMI